MKFTNYTFHFEILITGIFLTSSFTFADPNNSNYLKSFDDIQNGLKSIQESKNGCVNYSSPIDIKLIEKCQNQICNNMSQYQDTQKLPPRKLKEREKLIKKFNRDIEPELKILLEKEDQITNQRIADFERAETQPPKNNATNVQLIIEQNLELLLQNADKLKFDKENTLDEEETFKTIQDWSEEKKIHFLELHKAYSNNREMLLFKAYQILELKNFLQIEYGESTNKTLKKDAAKLEAQLLNYPIQLQPIHLQALEKAKKTGDLTKEEEIYYGTIYHQIALFSVSQEPAFQTPIPPENGDEIGMEQKKLEVKKSIEEWKTISRKKQKEYVINFCRSAYIASKLPSPTHDSITRFKKKIDGMRSQFISQVLPHFSKETEKKLKSTIQNTAFVYPDSKREIENKWNTFISQTKNRFKQSSQTLGNANNQISLDALNSFIQWPYRSVSDCRFLVPLPFSDHARIFSGKVAIGLKSVQFPELGKGTIFHELGHILSFEFQSKRASNPSTKTYKRTLDCLDARHKKETTYREGQYNEEDWADLISGLASGPDDLNPYCARASQFNIKFPINPSDSHSPPPFRFAHFHSIKHPLSNVCKLLFRDEFKSCMPNH